MNFHRINDRWGYPSKVAPVCFEFSDEYRLQLYLGSVLVSVEVIAVSVDWDDFLVYTEDQKEFRHAYHEIRRTYGNVVVRNLVGQNHYVGPDSFESEIWLGNPDVPFIRAVTMSDPESSLEQSLRSKKWQWDGSVPVKFSNNGSVVGIPLSQRASMEISWKVVDDRKVLIEGRKNGRNYLYALLVFDGFTRRYWGFSFFENRVLSVSYEF